MYLMFLQAPYVLLCDAMSSSGGAGPCTAGRRPSRGIHAWGAPLPGWRTAAWDAFVRELSKKRRLRTRATIRSRWNGVPLQYGGSRGMMLRKWAASSCFSAAADRILVSTKDRSGHRVVIA